MLAATLSPQSPNLGDGKSSLLILVLREGWGPVSRDGAVHRGVGEEQTDKNCSWSEFQKHSCQQQQPELL